MFAEIFDEVIIKNHFSLDTRTQVEKLISEHHFKSFMKRPFITLESAKVKIGHHH
jgi:hypothetical protein